MTNFNPAIVYDPGTGNVGLRFSYPPTGKPDFGDGAGDELQPVRSDSMTLSGLRQTVLIRQDRFRMLKMEFVPFQDLPAWRAFMQYAQTGGSFHYHVDADSQDYEIFELDDNQGSSSSSSAQGWTPKRAFRDFASFTLNMRKLGDGSGEVVP